MASRCSQYRAIDITNIQEPTVRAPETQPTAQNTPGKAARFPEPAAEPGEQAEKAGKQFVKSRFL
jgi:hypothetical protein